MWVPTRPDGLADVRAAAERARNADLQIAARARGPLEVWHPVVAYHGGGGGVPDGMFNSGWANEASGTYYPCAYMKDHMGFVHLRGRCFKDNGGVPINSQAMFQLPVNWRPDDSEAFWSHFVYIVGVTTAGPVNAITGTTSADVSLDGITFKAAG